MNSKHPIESSLISRFAASTAILAAAVVVLALVFLALTHGDLVDETLDTTLRGISLSLAERIWQQPDQAQQVARRHALGLVITYRGESMAFNAEGQPVSVETQSAVGNRYRRVEVEGPDGRSIIFFWDLVVFARAHVPILIILVALLLLMIGATYAFQLAQLRPLRWLRQGVESVSKGEFSHRVPVVRRDEIGQVALAFNEMTERVEGMMEDREQLLADVSHELRSPLARLKVAIELLPESEKRETIRRDVLEMETLTSALLERGRLKTFDASSGSHFDLAAIARHTIAALEHRSPGIRLHLSAEPLIAPGDEALIGVVLHNLLDNALKFSLEDSQPVEMLLKRTDMALEIVVLDDGPGIAEADLERVLKPFVKLDPARGHRAGYGLGLDLCRRIVEAHRGDLEVVSRQPRGLEVRVSMPTAEAT